MPAETDPELTPDPGEVPPAKPIPDLDPPEPVKATEPPPHTAAQNGQPPSPCAEAQRLADELQHRQELLVAGLIAAGAVIVLLLLVRARQLPAPEAGS